VREREEGGEGVGVGLGVGCQSGEGGGGEETAESVGVGGVEGARAPEEVADVHKEAVEVGDVGARVGFLVLRGSGHGGFEGEFVGGEHGTEAGEGAEGWGEEGEEVDDLRVGGGDGDGGVGDAVGEGFEVGEDWGNRG